MKQDGYVEPRLCGLTASETTRFFGADSGHVAVSMERLPNPRVLWMNDRELPSMVPAFANRASKSAVEDDLIAATALVTTYSNEGRLSAGIAFADRYGGDSIGSHGGSGRSVSTNVFHVKGIGRTPLVSSTADNFHASGGAYLEECCREIILSELASAEFPFGAVPSLALIDSGNSVVWDTDKGPKVERMTLLVRPSFLRAAHFERATNFFSSNPREGSLDHNRVSMTFKNAIEMWGKQNLVNTYLIFLERWAEQIAYGFAHRLTHCGYTTSNTCFDGRLVDFGATAAMPSWASIKTMPNIPRFGNEFAVVVSAAQSLGFYFGQFVSSELSSPEFIESVVAKARARYESRLALEVLRCCGLPRSVAEAALASSSHQQISRCIKGLIRHYQSEFLDIFLGTPIPSVSWDLAQMWSRFPPDHLKALRDEIKGFVHADTLGAIAERCRFRCAPRHDAYREIIKRQLYEKLELSLAGDKLSTPSLSRFLTKTIVNLRRDSRADPVDAVPLGFARSDTSSYSVHRSMENGELFAVEDFSDASSSAGVNSKRHAKRIKVLRVSDEDVVLEGKRRHNVLASDGIAHL
jgi:hypothetical protein